MPELRFHPDIYQEISDARNWYEYQATGLGDDFIQQLEAAFSSIQAMPDAWTVIEPGFRRYLLRRFPYGVIYQTDDNEILVVAVMHLNRKPGYWHQRLQ